GRPEASPVKVVYSAPQLVFGNRLPVGAAVSPERALRVDYLAKLLNQVSADTLRDLDVRADVERAVDGCEALNWLRRVDQLADRVCALLHQHVIEVFASRRNCH